MLFDFAAQQLFGEDVIHQIELWHVGLIESRVEESGDVSGKELEREKGDNNREGTTTKILDTVQVKLFATQVISSHTY